MDKSVENNRRNFVRVLFEGPVELICSAKKWRSELIDLSLKGALIKRPDDCAIELNQHAQIMFPLSHSTEAISMDVRIAHLSRAHIGMESIKIDLYSMAHLRKLIELNSGQKELFDRELSSLLKLHKS